MVFRTQVGEISTEACAQFFLILTHVCTLVQWVYVKSEYGPKKNWIKHSTQLYPYFYAFWRAEIREFQQN